MWWTEALAPMLALWLLFPARSPPPIPPLTSQVTEAEKEAEEAAGAALAFSWKAASSPKKFARGGSASENERVACASDFAAEEDEGEGGGVRLERLERRWRGREDGEGAGGARDGESGRLTPHPAKRSCILFSRCWKFSKGRARLLA